MAKKKTKVVIIGEEFIPKKCSVCGSVEETRPYGKGGAEVCFDCGMKDREQTDAAFAKRLEKGDFEI